MNAVFTGIYTRWTSEIGGTTLYNTEAPDSKTYPYVVVSIIANTPDWTFTEDFEDVTFQFNCYSDSETSADILTLFDAIKTAFDKYDLVVADAVTVSLVRGSANLIRDEGIWLLNVNYFLKIQGV